MRRLLATDVTGVILSWAAVAVVVFGVGWSVVRGSIGWTLFGVGLAAVLLVPPVAYRAADVMAPWRAALIAAVPFVVGATAPPGVVSQFAAYAAVAAVALLVAVEVETLTPVRMNRGFAVGLVFMTTLTAAGAWEVTRWAADVTLGTELVESNDAVMRRFVVAAVAGFVAGGVFDRYLDALTGTEFVPDGFDVDDTDDQVEATGRGIGALLERIGLSTGRQRLVVRGCQVVLAGIVGGGAVTLNLDAVVTGLVGLGATYLPAALRRERSRQADVGLTLWIAVAVVLHALGTVAFYQTVWGWHKVTHATTGTFVAAVGYTAVRSLETHADAVSFPPKFAFVVVVLFVFSVGVVWELLEFALDQVAAAAGSDGVILSQHGTNDTMSDMVANAFGATLVAGAATVYRLGRPAGGSDDGRSA